MAKQIALFNHKGGVSKTTTTFNLGWMLASKGKKVVIVDCDPQCNLTGMVLDFKNSYESESKEFKTVYEGTGVRNIRDGLAPAFESRPEVIKPVECEPLENQPNLYLLPGHIGLAEYEVTLGIAQELSGSLPTLQNLPGSLRHLFDKTAEKYMADYVLIDMSPSLGSINQNILMTSDFFIVPMAPDYFSVMAINSLASVLPRWASWAKQARLLPTLQNATYPFPQNNPKFLGTIVQKYRQRSGVPSAAFQKWIDDIVVGVKEKLIPALSNSNMMLPATAYGETGIECRKPLMQMSDFNSLIAMSQKHKAPVFLLSDEQLEQTGVVLANTKTSMNQFSKLFSDGAEKIISIIDNA